MAEIAKFINVGAVFDSLRCADVPNFELPIPPMPIQRGICALLDVIDGRIELNRRMNETLQAMARALFKSWFVDFEPVRAKMAERDTGLPKDIADRFPDALDDGRPEAWNRTTVGSITETRLGGTPSRKRPEFWSGSVPWINSGKVNEFRITSPTEYITNQGLASSATKLLPKRTVLIAITGATLGQVSLNEIETCANQSIVGVVGNAAMPSEFLYFWITENAEQLLALRSGAAQQHINKRNVDEMELLCPTPAVMQSWIALARPTFDSIARNCFESESLAESRDLLLPKLISGELRMPDAERIAAAVI